VSAPEPAVRFAARAILIDDQDRVLLFRARVPGPAERFIWITPGGGIERGEDEATCVRREVFEETGRREIALGPCVWRRDHTFRWGDGTLRQVEAYYLVRTSAFEIDVHNMEEPEQAFLSSHRWFSLAELAEQRETLVPGDFAELLVPLLRGEIPAEPIIVGI